MWKTLRPAIVSFCILSLITGILYPWAVTGLSQLLFPAQAEGSLIIHNHQAVGSRWIGQSFSDPRYFWSRPSATSPMPYNGLASSGSNQGPTNPALIDAVKMRIQALRTADPDNRHPIPIDLVTASASGLDPQISPAAALYQVERVARTRGLQVTMVQSLVTQHIERRQGRLLGEPRVNVLELNLALDGLSHSQ
ncbi:MAG: potassium-transporting ATPase subunit KdpC [Betaproteobacteria bacterium]|nr:potassium-transporting ATPase subunit KdpC [Betaproteobacteria bacterium]